MTDVKPIEIKMTGAAGTVEMVIPYTYVCYYTGKKNEDEEKLMAAVNVAIEAYKALEPK